jgi:hypothetical protein
MKYFIFYRTNDVFKAEELLIENKINCKIVSTPVQDKAYCGVCVRVNAADETTKEILSKIEFIEWEK